MSDTAYVVRLTQGPPSKAFTSLEKAQAWAEGEFDADDAVSPGGRVVGLTWTERPSGTWWELRFKWQGARIERVFTSHAGIDIHAIDLETS